MFPCKTPALGRLNTLPQFVNTQTKPPAHPLARLLAACEESPPLKSFPRRAALAARRAAGPHGMKLHRPAPLAQRKGSKYELRELRTLAYLVQTWFAEIPAAINDRRHESRHAIICRAHIPFHLPGHLKHGASLVGITSGTSIADLLNTAAYLAQLEC